MLMCIKEKCEYCEEDDFRISCYRCVMIDRLFKKDSDIECTIDIKINSIRKYLGKLERLEKFIGENQNE